MAKKKAHSHWKVLPHGPLEKLDERLWHVAGEVPGMPIGRHMCVARLSDGRLLIHNAIPLEDALMAELEAWGEPAVLVVPNGWHRLDCLVYKQRYPQLRVLCPAGSKKRVEQVIAVDGSTADFDGDDAISLLPVAGIKDVEGILAVRAEAGRTLVFNDLLFNLPHQPGFFGLIFRLLGSTGGPRVTRMMRLMAVRDRKALAQQLSALASEPGLSRLIPGHGAMIEQDAGLVLRTVADGLR